MNRRKSNRQGSIFVLMLFLLPIVILFIGFAVDVSYIQRVKSELRSSTDLAAKTAAATLSLTQSEAMARTAAIEIAGANFVAGESLTLDASNIVFGSASIESDGSYSFTLGGSPTNAVRVTGSREASSNNGSVGSFFGVFYGHPEFEPVVNSFAAFIDVDICLVLDRSSSMKTPVSSSDTADPDYVAKPPKHSSRWVALDESVRSFLAVMNATAATEKVGMVTFASDYTDANGSNPKAFLDQDLTTNLTSIESALNTRLSTVWNGNTDIYAGIEMGTQVLTSSSARPYARQIMVVLTDGNYTEADPTPAATAAAAQGILIHTITFSQSADQTTMANIAEIGGGKHYHADTASDLDSVFREIAASLPVLIH